MNSIDEKRYAKISFLILFFLVIVISFQIVSSFLLAIIVGALIAQQAKPLQIKLIDKKVNAKLAAYLFLIALVIIMIGPFFFFLQRLIIESSKFTQYISSSDITFDSISNKIINWPVLNHFFSDSSSLEVELRNLARTITGIVSGLVLQLAKQLPSLFIDTIFILISFIVFLLNGPKIYSFISNLIPIEEYIKSSLVIASNEISKIAIVAAFLAAAGQSLLILLGFYFLKIPNAFLAFGATFMLSFIPFIGSTPVWVAGVIYLIFKGTTLKIVFMISIGIVTGLIDNVIRAFALKSSKGRLHPFVGLISVIGGIQVFGLLGVLIGPLIVTLFLAMCKVSPSVLKDNPRKNS
ncbi:MAG: AI-2E family transporter [Bdellovibrio sp.]|nr:AI-2E family transporter [Bdellovibrio sp.]